MEGVSRPAGSGVPIEWKGETLVLEPLGLKQWGEIEQYLLKQKPDPIKVAARIKKELGPLAPETEEKLTAEAYRDARQGNYATEQEVMTFARSQQGLAFCFWLCFERRYPGRFKLQETTEVIDSMSPQELEEKFNELLQASGLDQRGNSTGPPRRETRPQRRARERAAKKSARRGGS